PIPTSTPGTSSGNHRSDLNKAVTKGRAGTEPREAFGVRRIPALLIGSKDRLRSKVRIQGKTKQRKRRNAAHSKRFATTDAIPAICVPPTMASPMTNVAAATANENEFQTAV